MKLRSAALQGCRCRPCVAQPFRAAAAAPIPACRPPLRDALPMYEDLTDFLADLDRRGMLARVKEPVSPDLEIAAVTDRACKSPNGGPALLFEQPGGFSIPVASNVYGSDDRMCLALGVRTLDDLAKEIDELMTP